jgi:hypothetical protein
MKLCKDCKHYRSGLCGHPLATSLDDGLPRYSCNSERQEGKIISWLEGKCGKAGRYWEAKV